MVRTSEKKGIWILGDGEILCIYLCVAVVAGKYLQSIKYAL